MFLKYNFALKLSGSKNANDSLMSNGIRANLSNWHLRPLKYDVPIYLFTCLCTSQYQPCVLIGMIHSLPPNNDTYLKYSFPWLGSYLSSISPLNYLVLHEDLPNKSSTHWSSLPLTFNNTDWLRHSLEYFVVVLYCFSYSSNFKNP